MNIKVKKALAYAFLFSIINNLAHPVTPKFILDNNLDTRVFGYMLAAMGFGSMVSARFWGKLWDKYQNKWTVILPYSVFYSVGQLLLSQSTTEYTVLLSRVFSGLFAAGLLYSTFPALISSHSQTKNTSSNQVYLFGILAFASNIGYAIGGYFGDLFGAKNTIIIQAILVALSIIPGTLLVSSMPKALEKNKVNTPSIIDCVCESFFSNKVYHYLILLIPFFMIRASIGKFFDLQLLSNGYTTSQLGLIVMVMGMLSTVFMFTVGKKMSKKINNIKLLPLLLTLISIPLIIASMSQSNNMLILSFTIIGLFIPLSNSLTSAILAKRFSHKKGEVLGVRKAVHDIGLVFGPIIFGLIYNYSTWLTFMLAGIILIPAIFIFAIFNSWFNKKLGEIH